MRYFILEKDSFIADQLVAAGSRLTEELLNGAEPGSAWIETDESGRPLDPKDSARLLAIGVNFAPVQVAPVSPHAPNPTKPQAIPAQPSGGVQIAGNRQYVPGDGVESNEAAEARVERLKAELAVAEEVAAAARNVKDEPVAPVRRSAAPAATDPAATKGPLDGSVPDLETHLAAVTDTNELNSLRKEEEGGKNRVGALAAIDARFAELSA